jgi:hypothetical protein
MKTLVTAVNFGLGKPLAVFAVGLAVSALASPSFAQRSGAQMSAVRAAAIRECNIRCQKFTQHTWGVTQIDIYRACMAEHGQPE